ncbi:hypothetical protein A2886_00960 [candidate division WWE3 bacterium RIFCSPHIGHO2_01_FULL_42_13]|uniref:Methyltransferase type 11 domain-containing protein n=1 Tax=candidate division WWE3 bacterium RIFCSPHIGHO2_01_FULL_42_13 TaxID=1802617 RepID=A0A1F4UQX6_UNCKA|nr:MAG: hypothetical protein A2886_00960 [candidate division WWE3 bacterium RIFCSPHIGHO2_01_FULL_42_13]
MNYKEYENMEKFEKSYWWHRGRLYLLEKLINSHFQKKRGDAQLLEVGSGTGETVKFLSNFGKVTGIDVSERAVEFCRSKGLENIILGDINELDLSEHKNTYDAVFALDTMEHIQDDVGAMKRINEMLKEEGLLFLTVPAHKFLWSEHDEALHHKRRYHSLELLQKLRDAGFEPIKKSYFVFTAFFPILFFRTWNTVFGRSAYPKTSYVMLPKILNDFATNVLKLEAKIIQKINFPIGTTIVAVAKKPKI